MKFIQFYLIFLLIFLSTSLDINANFDDIKASDTPLKDFITNFPKDDSQILKQANERLIKVNEASSNFELSMVDNRYVLMATKTLKSNTTILQFDDQECISVVIMSQKHFIDPINLDKLTSDIQLFKELKTAVWQKGILALTYHLYNMKESKYFWWIQTIPKEIPSLIKDFSMAEIDLLQGDEIYDETLQYIKTLKGDYVALKQQIDQDWTDSQKQSFFNNNEFTIGDYYFVRQILELCGFVRKSANDQSFFAIPAFMYIPMGKQLNTEIKTIQIFMDRPTKSLHLIVKNSNDIPKGDIISIKLYQKGEESQYFIALGKVQNEGCVDVKLADFEGLIIYDEEMKQEKIQLIKSISGSQGIHCLSANNFSRSVFISLQNIINMNEVQTSHCSNEALVPSSYFSDEKQIKFQVNNYEKICEKPEWKMNQLEFIQKELNVKEQFFENKIKQIEEFYKEQRLKIQENLLFLQYFQLKQQIVIGLKQQILSILNEKNFNYEIKSDL